MIEMEWNDVLMFLFFLALLEKRPISQINRSVSQRESETNFNFAIIVAFHTNNFYFFIFVFALM